jgi:hypothetical protein
MMEVMDMISKPRVLRVLILAGASTLLALGFAMGGASAALPGGSLDPASIAKYASPLVVPPAMPPVTQSATSDYYEIAVRQFEQQILPSDLPPTTVWGYGSVADPSTFNYPAFTI